MSFLQDFLDSNLKYNLDTNDNLQIENNLGLLIKKKRTEKKLSQKDLSNLTGITQANISNIEKGKANITISQLKKIAKSMNLKIKIELEEF